MHAMKFLKSLATISLGAVLMVGCSSGNNAAPADNGSTPAPAAEAGGGEVTAQIGVVSFLTGSGAAYGEAQKAGLELALEELNEANKGKLKIDLKFEDSAGKKEGAINAVNKLINQDNVVAIIGPTLSSEMFAAAPVANDAEVPVFGISTTAEGINDIGEYVFRNALPESIAVPTAMKAAVERDGIKKVALIYASNDDFSVNGYKVMKATAENMGLEVTGEATFSIGDVDFAAQLTKLNQGKPDALLISALYKEGSMVVKKARELGYQGTILGGNGFNNPKVFEIAGDAAEGLIVATPFSPEKQDEKVQSFVKAFEAKYNKKPDQFAAQAYDSLYIMSQALLGAGKADREALREQLAGLKDFTGVSGKLSFDENRNPVGVAVVVEAKSGKFVPFE